MATTPDDRPAEWPKKQNALPETPEGRHWLMNSSGLCDETDTDVLIAMNGNLAHRRRFAKSRSKH